MTNRFINPRPQFLDTAGNPLLKGEMNFYENGTLIRKDTFSDVNEKNKNANPVLLNADGTLPNVFYAGTARAVLTFDPGTGQQQRFDLDGVGQFGSGAAFDIFNTLTEYEIGALVEASDGEYYRSLQNNNTGNDPLVSPTFWERLEFIRTFNVNVTYGIDDIAKASDGLIFRSLQANNLNNDPLTSPLFWGTPVAFVDLNVLGNLSFAATELTISSGSVAAETSHHAIDTEADAATDDLDTITVAGVANGTMLFLRLANAARVVTIKDGTGNITTKNNEDFILDAFLPALFLRVGTDWFEVQRPVVDNPFDQSLNKADDAEFNDLTVEGGNLDIGTGAFIAPGAGRGRLNATALDGLHTTGSGSLSDHTCINKNGQTIWKVPTGTTETDFIGGIRLGGAGPENLIDDFERGLWTVTISDAVSGGNTATVASSVGYYTKIDDIVQIAMDAQNIDTTGMTAGNGLQVQGLPFTAILDASHREIVSIVIGNTTFLGYISGWVDSNTTVITILNISSGGNIGNLLVSALTSGNSDMYITFSYRTTL